jgi:hypothetical protein
MMNDECRMRNDEDGLLNFLLFTCVRDSIFTCSFPKNMRGVVHLQIFKGCFSQGFETWLHFIY